MRWFFDLRVVVPIKNQKSKIAAARSAFQPLARTSGTFASAVSGHVIIAARTTVPAPYQRCDIRDFMTNFLVLGRCGSVQNEFRAPTITVMRSVRSMIARLAFFRPASSPPSVPITSCHSARVQQSNPASKQHPRESTATRPRRAPNQQPPTFRRRDRRKAGA